MIPTREQAWGILTKYVTTDSQLKHGMAVEAAMRYFARKAGQDEVVKSVKKKFQDRHFAAGCNRDVIRRGVERMGISLDELMEGVILGMRDAADALGLGMQA